MAGDCSHEHSAGDVQQLIRNLVALSTGNCSRTDEILESHQVQSRLKAQVLDLQRANGGLTEQLLDLQQARPSPHPLPLPPASST